MEPILCGLLCAFGAKIFKNRSFFGWFFIGIIFNVLGIIILIFMSNKQKH